MTMHPIALRLSAMALALEGTGMPEIVAALEIAEREVIRQDDEIMGNRREIKQLKDILAGKTGVPGDPRTECVKELLLGLTSEGEDSKQFFLERAFRALCEGGYVDKARQEFKWPNPMNDKQTSRSTT
jgi:hypothetical protein